MAVKGVGMIAAGGKGGPTSFPTFIGGRSPQSCTVTDFEMETSNFVLFLLISGEISSDLYRYHVVTS